MHQWIPIIVLVYLAGGILFSLFFHFWGGVKMDKDIRNTSLLFRILITPGIVGLWPVLFIKWMSSSKNEA